MMTSPDKIERDYVRAYKALNAAGKKVEHAHTRSMYADAEFKRVGAAYATGPDLTYAAFERMTQDQACVRAFDVAEKAADDYQRALIAQDKAEAEFQRAASAAVEAKNLAK